MLKIADRPLTAAATSILTQLQSLVDSEAGYPAQVARAKLEWERKSGTVAKQAAFQIVRATLEQMCVGSIRCAYCEDSLADEVEHIRPKNLFPAMAFTWSNYLFACGPCNGPKSNRYGVVAGANVMEFKRRRNGPVVPPPAGQSGFIDPRHENPLDLLELDLGGTTPDGEQIKGTFEMLAVASLSSADCARANYTINVLDLNREAIRAARENAYGGFRARMKEYVVAKEAGATTEKLVQLKDDLLNTPHLTVFAEIRRQRAWLPTMHDLLARAPEMLNWNVSPVEI
jgi:uncharacterized protein (TIGR02646 family)